jgi:anti-anti-sigma regulatory factor
VHFVAISKLPEFTEDGEVVPGQCEPYTSGWRLRLIVDGAEEVLLTGTYYELRRIQRRCIGKPPDDIKGLVAQAKESAGEVAAPPPAAEEGESTQILGVDDVRRAMLEMEAAVNTDGAPAQLEWVEVDERDGITIASVRLVGQSVDADELNRVLQSTLAQARKGLVVDLSEVQVSSPSLARCLRDLGDRARLENRQLAIVCPYEPLQQAANEAASGSLKFCPDVDAAVKASSPVENLP